MQQDGPHNQSTTMGRRRCFQEGQGAEGVAFYDRKQWECMAPCLGMDNEPAGTLRISTSVQTNTGSTVVGVHYRPPSQEEVDYDTFFRHLEEASHLQVVVFMGDFNHPSNCWTGNIAQYKQSRRSLEHSDTNFLTQVTKEPMRGDALLDLILINKEELSRNVKAGTVMAAMTILWWSSRSYVEGRRQIAGSQPWTSGEQILVCSGTC